MHATRAITPQGMSPDLDLAGLVKKALSREEVAHAVAYVADNPLPAGTHLNFPKAALDLPWKAFVVFVDREPAANWSHPSRYLLIRADNGEVKSIEAQLPPFGRGPLHWRVLYQAPGVPDPLLAVPKAPPR
jgi:hypothetical protein